MKVIVVGGGFAGRWAAGQLHLLKRRLPGSSVILYDVNPYTTMPPAYPGVVSGDFGMESVTGSLARLLPDNVEFRQAAVTSVDLRAKTVTADAADERYDYLVLACGSVTNLHGFNQSLESVYTLDTADGAFRMGCALNAYLERSAHPVCVIAGGSYTGVELACEIYKLGRRRGREITIVIVEPGKELLALLDPETRRRSRAHIERLGIRSVTGATVAGFDGREVRLSSGETLPDAFLCWCAGTKRAIEDIRGDFETLPDKRIIVNEYLQVPNHPEVFAPADTGAVRLKGQYLRKAVTFALYSGRRAGRNILRAAQGRPLIPFHTFDPGEVLPLYGTSSGFVLGFITGRLGLRLHYFMSGYRNFSAANRLEFFARALAPADREV